MSERTVDGITLQEMMEQEFAQGRGLELTVTGTSMEPLLRGARDQVILVSPKQCKPEVGDIVFFQRKSGEYVLHRVVGRNGKGVYRINGDAQTWEETIEKGQVCAVVAAMVRKGHYFSRKNLIYRLYILIWQFIRPIRGCIFRTVSEIKSWRKRKKADV